MWGVPLERRGCDGGHSRIQWISSLQPDKQTQLPGICCNAKLNHQISNRPERLFNAANITD